MRYGTYQLRVVVVVWRVNNGTYQLRVIVQRVNNGTYQLHAGVPVKLCAYQVCVVVRRMKIDAYQLCVHIWCTMNAGVSSASAMNAVILSAERKVLAPLLPPN